MVAGLVLVFYGELVLSSEMRPLLSKLLTEASCMGMSKVW
jgi:hypothetical protein